MLFALWTSARSALSLSGVTRPAGRLSALTLPARPEGCRARSPKRSPRIGARPLGASRGLPAPPDPPGWSHYCGGHGTRSPIPRALRLESPGSQAYARDPRPPARRLRHPDHGPPRPPDRGADPDRPLAVDERPQPRRGLPGAARPVPRSHLGGGSRGPDRRDRGGDQTGRHLEGQVRADQGDPACHHRHPGPRLLIATRCALPRLARRSERPRRPALPDPAPGRRAQDGRLRAALRARHA